MKMKELKSKVHETNSIMQDIVLETGMLFPDVATQAFDIILKKYGKEKAITIMKVFTDAIEKGMIEQATQKVLIEMEKEDVCEMCNGTGEVEDDVWDEDSKNYQPTGTRTCDCVLFGREEKEY